MKIIESLCNHWPRRDIVAPHHDQQFRSISQDEQLHDLLVKQEMSVINHYELLLVTENTVVQEPLSSIMKHFTPCFIIIDP